MNSTDRNSIIYNVVLVQLVWIVSVLGQAHDLPLLGLGAAILSLLLQFRKALLSGPTLIFLTNVALIGFVLDLIIVSLGAVDFIFEYYFPYPLSMTALWISFGSTYFFSLKWLRDRLLLSSMLGFIGGGSAYYGAMKLGAIVINPPLLRSMIIISIVWSIVVPLFGAMHKRSVG